MWKCPECGSRRIKSELSFNVIYIGDVKETASGKDALFLGKTVSFPPTNGSFKCLKCGKDIEADLFSKILYMTCDYET